MNWKSYAAASGATVVAGWLASSTPPQATPAAGRPAVVPAGSAPVSAGADIEEQAARLQARLQVERSYAEPRRNPFRFADRAAVDDGVGDDPAPEPAAPPAADVAPAPGVSLAGIAEDAAPGGVERLAILSASTGVLIVRAGDDVLGQYRVLHVDSEAVELQLLADGTTRRLTLVSPGSR